MVIHPTSVFATDPEVLLLPEEESRDMGNATGTQFPIFSGDQTCFAVDRFTLFVSTISHSRRTLEVVLEVIHCFDSQMSQRA